MVTESHNKRTFLTTYGFELTCVLIAITLVTTALYHQSLIHELDRYRSKPLIFFEILSLLSAIVACFAQMVRTIINMATGNNRYFFGCVTLAILFGSVVFSFWHDSATLLYAT